jgi:hypothetical protein
MNGPLTERQPVEDVGSTVDEPMLVGALVHRVLNSTAAIKYAAGVLRARGALNDIDLAELARIEESAAMVARTVKTFASGAEAVAAASREDRVVDLYSLCCELAAHWRATEGRPIYCRAHGDSRGSWNRQELVAIVSALMQRLLGCLPPTGMLNIVVSGLVRHVRIEFHGLGALTPAEQRGHLEQASTLGGPHGSMVTVTISRSGGAILSLRLPRS